MKYILLLAIAVSAVRSIRIEKEVKDFISLKDVNCTAAGATMKPSGKQTPAAGKCNRGYHLSGKNCLSNANNCNDFDCKTMNCQSCGFWYWHVSSDQKDAAGALTGNYCVSRVWAWVLLFVGCFLFLLLLVGIIMYFACKGKKATKSEKTPLVTKAPKVGATRPHVGATRPDHHVETHDHGVTRGEPKVTRHPANVREVRHDPIHGLHPPVHVETRSYSPAREMNRVVHDDPDWAAHSQAHWNEY